MLKEPRCSSQCLTFMTQVISSCSLSHAAAPSVLPLWHRWSHHAHRVTLQLPVSYLYDTGDLIMLTEPRCSSQCLTFMTQVISSCLYSHAAAPSILPLWHRWSHHAHRATLQLPVSYLYDTGDLIMLIESRCSSQFLPLWHRWSHHADIVTLQLPVSYLYDTGDLIMLTEPRCSSQFLTFMTQVISSCYRVTLQLPLSYLYDTGDLIMLTEPRCSSQFLTFMTQVISSCWQSHATAPSFLPLWHRWSHHAHRVTLQLRVSYLYDTGDLIMIKESRCSSQCLTYMTQVISSCWYSHAAALSVLPLWHRWSHPAHGATLQLPVSYLYDTGDLIMLTEPRCSSQCLTCMTY